MKVYFDKQWVIERDDGTTLRLSWNESGLLYNLMRREEIWSEVALRLDENPAWPQIEEVKDDILDDICYQDDLSEDLIWYVVGLYVDLDTYGDPND